MPKATEHRILLREAAKIAAAIAESFAPICEVVLHDLTRPDHAIVQIDNNLSGRRVGGPATELGLARIADPQFPDVLVNYPNTFPDGRKAKSTSIGLKDSRGKFVAALCLNIDVSYLESIAAYIGKFVKTEHPDVAVKEKLGHPKPATIEDEIRTFSAGRNKDPRALTSAEKRTIIVELSRKGYLDHRGAAQKISRLIGSSRSGVYYYIKSEQQAAAKA